MTKILRKSINVKTKLKHVFRLKTSSYMGVKLIDEHTLLTNISLYCVEYFGKVKHTQRTF